MNLSLKLGTGNDDGALGFDVWRWSEVAQFFSHAGSISEAGAQHTRKRW
jgi:hypothetical protein